MPEVVYANEECVADYVQDAEIRTLLLALGIREIVHHNYSKEHGYVDMIDADRLYAEKRNVLFSYTRIDTAWERAVKGERRVVRLGFSPANTIIYDDAGRTVSFFYRRGLFDAAVLLNGRPVMLWASKRNIYLATDLFHTTSNIGTVAHVLAAMCIAREKACVWSLKSAGSKKAPNGRTYFLLTEEQMREVPVRLLLPSLSRLKRLMRSAVKYVEAVPVSARIHKAVLELTIYCNQAIINDKLVRVEPVEWRGTLTIDETGAWLEADGPFKHPHIVEGVKLCTGDLGVFDGSLLWVARLINALATPNLDSPGNRDWEDYWENLAEKVWSEEPPPGPEEDWEEDMDEWDEDEY